jgi:type II secretory pathway component PulC
MLIRILRLATMTLIVASAWFVAGALGETTLQEVGAGVDLAAPRGGEPPAEPVASPPAREPIDRQELLGTNLFALPPEPPAPPGPPVRLAVIEHTAAALAGPPPPCALPFRVLALVAYERGGPQRSQATIDRGGSVLDVQVGDHLDDAVITRIAWNRVFLRRGGGDGECFLDIRRTEMPRPPSPARDEPRRTKESSARPEPTRTAAADDPFHHALDEGIVALSETEFTVQRSLIRTIQDNVDLAMASTRVVPAKNDGITTGFRLFGGRDALLPEHLGLRNGDVIAAANGLPFDSMDNVLRAYGLLRMADEISLEIVRRGQRQTLLYHLR